MAQALHAWAPISTKNGIIPEGDKVTKDQVPEPDWSSLIACGVLRKQPYPKGVRTDESPRNAQLRQINEAVKEMTAPFQNPDMMIGDDESDDETTTTTTTENDGGKDERPFWERLGG